MLFRSTVSYEVFGIFSYVLILFLKVSKAKKVSNSGNWVPSFFFFFGVVVDLLCWVFRK